MKPNDSIFRIYIGYSDVILRSMLSKDMKVKFVVRNSWGGGTAYRQGEDLFHLIGPCFLGGGVVPVGCVWSHAGLWRSAGASQLPLPAPQWVSGGGGLELRQNAIADLLTELVRVYCALTPQLHLG